MTDCDERVLRAVTFERERIKEEMDEIRTERDALKAERADLIKINNGWTGEWDAMREERDALQRNCTALVQMFELAVSIPSMSDEQLRQLVANGRAAIDAAREKP